MTRKYMIKVAGSVVLLMLLTGVMVESSAASPWHRRHHHKRNIARLPAGCVHIGVGGHRYYYNAGLFYQPAASGYVSITAPIGARIAVLPRGYVKLRYRGRPYYHYAGVYYVYHPMDRVYVVVNPPSEITVTSADGLDEIRLTNGSILKGEYLGSSKSTVKFKVGGKKLKIPIETVASMSVSP